MDGVRFELRLDRAVSERRQPEAGHCDRCHFTEERYTRSMANELASRGVLTATLALALACGGESATDSGSSGGTSGSGGTSQGGTGGSSGGAGGTSATGGAGGSTGGSAGVAGTSGSAGAGGGCNAANCEFTCCDDVCVNTDNDIQNCGSCGNVCGGSSSPFCNAGTCEATPPCNGPLCGPAGTCCGSSCCTPDQLCCDVPGPVETGLTCVTPINGTCPPGCKSCKCNGPDTPIATPLGERAIAELSVGDLVYSVHQNAIVAVPITLAQRVPAPNHTVMEIELGDGKTLHVSAKHPLADGRSVGDLAAGDTPDGIAIVSSQAVPLTGGGTYDILPASDSGTYFAAGVRFRSTLAPR
jgi:hypothetical protein